MKVPRLLIAILLIIVLIGGGFLVYRSNTASPTTTAATTGFTQTYQVRQGNIASTISVVGQLEAVQSASLTFERMSGSAKLQTLQVKTGAVVTAGQVLATIDPATYQQALDQAKSDYQAAVEKLDDLKAPATSLELAKADLAVAQAEYNLGQGPAGPERPGRHQPRRPPKGRGRRPALPSLRRGPGGRAGLRHRHRGQHHQAQGRRGQGSSRL